MRQLQQLVRRRQEISQQVPTLGISHGYDSKQIRWVGHLHIAALHLR